MKSQKPRVIIFGRFPQLGVGKTRLAADIGAYATWRFYRTNLCDTVRNLRDPRWQLVFCATPDQIYGLQSFAGCRLLKQGKGTLGQRLVRQFRQNPILIIGSDVPGLKRQDISAALKKLNKGRAVIGPSNDGGFWCIGLRGKKPSPRTLDGLPWSSADTMTATQKRLEQTAYPTELTTTHDDVDDLVAYKNWKSKIPKI